MGVVITCQVGVFAMAVEDDALAVANQRTVNPTDGVNTNHTVCANRIGCIIPYCVKVFGIGLQIVPLDDVAVFVGTVVIARDMCSDMFARLVALHTQAEPGRFSFARNAPQA